MTGQLQNYEIENRLFNICVGKTVGGKSPEVSRVFLNLLRTEEEQNQNVDAGEKNENKPEVEQEPEVEHKSTAEEQPEEKTKTVTIQPPAEEDDTLPEDFVPPTREELQRKKSVAGLGKYLQGFLGDQTFDDFLRTYAPVIPESKVIYGAEPIQNKWKRNPNTGYWQR